MSFIYPRTLRISRPAVSVELGLSEYSGESSVKEECIAENIPASIQFKRPSGKPEAMLPADAAKTTWRIFIPLGALALGAVQTRDIITDDLSARYQVDSPYWNSLGHALTCTRLET